MQIGIRAVTGAVLGLTMFAGDIAALSLTPSEASAWGRGGYYGGGGFRGGGFYRGGGYGFGGYRGGYGFRGYRVGYGFRGGYGFPGGFGYGGFGYRGFGYGGFGAGDFLLGAAVVGGIAAIATSANRNYDDGYATYRAYPPEVANGAPPQGAYAPPPVAETRASTDPVEQCSRVAEQEAASNGDSGRVRSIDRVDTHQNGAQVVGTLEVRKGDRNGATDRARFTCTADYGQVTAFRFG